MNVLNIEIYSLMIIAILAIDYYSKYKNKLGLNSYLYLFLIASLTLMSVLNLVANIFVLNDVILKAIMFSAAILAMFSSSCIYVYVKINMFEARRDVLKIFLGLGVYFVCYLMYLIYVFNIKDAIVIESFPYILRITNYNYALVLTNIPLMLLFIETLIRSIFRKYTIDFKLLLAFLIPILGIIFDLWHDQIMFWIPANILSLLIMYIYTNNNIIYIDPLTKLYNRKVLESNSFNRMLLKDKVGVFYIDVDDFKTINDTYGNDVGDELLKATGNILKNSVRKTDFAVRMGGDEFLIVTNLDKEERIEKVKSRINKAVDNYNTKNDIKISLSIGHGLYRKKEVSFDKLLSKIDDKMYKDKLKRKAKKRSR